MLPRRSGLPQFDGVGKIARRRVASFSAVKAILAALPHKRRFFGPAAEVVNRTFFAQRTLRLANVTPMQDQPVMGVESIRRWHQLLKFRLNLERIPTRREPGPIADAKNVGIDRYRL